MYLFAGYFCKRIINDKNKKYVYTLGILGFLITVFGDKIFPVMEGKTNIAGAYILFTVAFYTFFEREINITNKKIIYLIEFLSKHSYSIYLIHWYVVGSIIARVFPDSLDGAYYILSWGIATLLSIMIAAFFDICINNPIQKFMRKTFLKNYK